MGIVIEWPLSTDTCDKTQNCSGVESRPSAEEIEVAERVWELLDERMRTLKRCLKAVDAAVDVISDREERLSLEENIFLIRSVLSKASQKIESASQVPLCDSVDEDDFVA